MVLFSATINASGGKSGHRNHDRLHRLVFGRHHVLPQAMIEFLSVWVYSAGGKHFTCQEEQPCGASQAVLQTIAKWENSTILRSPNNAVEYAM